MLIKKYTIYVYFIASKPLLLGVLSLLVLLLSYPIFTIHTDSTGEGWLPKNSNKLRIKNLYQKKFGSDETLIIYLTFPDTTSKSYRIETLKKINDSLTKNIYGIEHVFSKYSIEQLKGLLGKKYAEKIESVYFNNNDTTGEIIFLKQRLGKEIIKERGFLLDSIRKTLSGITPQSVKVNISGQGIVFDEINRLITTDSVKLFIICFFIIILLLWWQVKSKKYLLLSLGLVLFTMLPSLSLFGWLHVPFNMITMTVPLLFAINFSSYAVHIITKESNNTHRYIAKKVPPVFTSALASIIGFGSLSVSNIKIISQFGILSSLGIFTGLAVLFLIGIPLAVRLVKKNIHVEKKIPISYFLENYYHKLNYKISLFLVFLSLIMVGISIDIAPTISVDTNMIHFMKPNNPVRQSINYIQKHYGDANTIMMLAQKTDSSKLSNKDLRKIHKVCQQMNKLSFVRNVADYKLWFPAIAKLSLINSYASKALSNGFLTKDRKYSKLSFNIPTGTVHEMKLMLNKINQITEKELKGTSIKISPAGFLPLYIEQIDTIVQGMMSGLALAVVLILIVMIVLVKDIKLGIITIIVTMLPLFILAIIMKIFAISFDVGTAIIFSVVIGMIADDALHIIWSYKQTLKNNKQQSTIAIFSISVRKIIYPCIVTSIMFSIGFSVLIFSKISIVENFGILSAATIILAWISDFLIFPALLSILYPIKTE